MDILDWLCNDNYRTYNVLVAKKLGSVNAAIYLSELISNYKYYKSINELIAHEKHGEGWFFYTDTKCEERTALSEKESRNARCLLTRLGLIIEIRFGQPGKNHYKINEEKLSEFFGFSKNSSRTAKRADKTCQKGELDPPKGRTLYKNHIEEQQEEPEEDVLCFSTQGSQSSVLFYKNGKGEKRSIEKCLIHRHFADQPHLAPFIDESIKIAEETEFINDILKFLKGTLYNLLKKSKEKVTIKQPKEYVINKNNINAPHCLGKDYPGFKEMMEEREKELKRER